jgi:hypothetical protein
LPSFPLVRYIQPPTRTGTPPLSRFFFGYLQPREGQGATEVRVVKHTGEVEIPLAQRGESLVGRTSDHGEPGDRSGSVPETCICTRTARGAGPAWEVEVSVRRWAHGSWPQAQRRWGVDVVQAGTEGDRGTS